MKTGRILGRDQQKEELGRAAVQRFEVHALRAAAEHAEDSGDAPELAMRDGDAVADRGRSQPFAFVEDPEQLSKDISCMRLAQALRQFGQNLGFGAAAKLRNDHLRTQDFRDLHSRQFRPPERNRQATAIRAGSPSGVMIYAPPAMLSSSPDAERPPEGCRAAAVFRARLPIAIPALLRCAENSRPWTTGSDLAGFELFQVLFNLG